MINSEVKYFWRKMLSSSRFSCVLDSILHGLRQVNHKHCEKTLRNRPMKAEITSEKESNKLTAIKAI